MQFVECHGTGTAVGDPIEIAALDQAFGRPSDGISYCQIGSVKTNIGHLDTAAGVASLIKATLALQHRAIPPSLHYRRPNPHSVLANSAFRVADALTPWPPLVDLAVCATLVPAPRHKVRANTTARIRNACNELNQKFIMSKDFMDCSDLTQWQGESLGIVDLKGKATGIELFSIKI